MSQPRSGNRAPGEGDGGATRARHFMGDLPLASRLGQRRQGGGRKSSRKTWRLTTVPLIRGLFSRLCDYSEGRQSWQAGRGPASGWGLRPSNRRSALPGRSCQLDSSAIGRRVCDRDHRPDFRRINFPLIERLSVSYELQGNIGNKGTVYVSQAEHCAIGARWPVPKASGDIGNRGTDLPDPKSGKSARVWHPPAPSSR